ncbi:MAG: T9SS type A sorting domain-containing protein, partial [Bacteroidota bacterium]
LSYPDGTLALTLQVEILAAGPLSADLLQLNGPVVAYAENGAAEEINISLIRSSITNCREAKLSGRLKNESGQGIARATVSLLQNGTLVDQQITGPDGNYTFTVTQSSGYSIRPSKLINYRNHVNSGDLSAIRRHIFNVEPLIGPYRRIAADVGNINAINSGDISLIRQLIFGIVDQFPGVPSWEFVPEAHQFSDPAQPTSSPYPRQLNLGTVRGDQSNLDFIGIKMGDPSNGANPQNLQSGGTATNKLASDLAFSISANEPIKGVPWTVDIYADQFREMVAAQFTMTWDSAKLDFLTVENLNPDLGISAENFSFLKTKNGLLPWLWFTDADPVSLPDSALLFSLRFVILGEVGDSLAVHFTESPTRFYFENNQGDIEAALTGNNYTVTRLTSVNGSLPIPELSVIPNPARNFFTISGLASSRCTVSLYNSQGKRLSTRIVSQATEQIPLIGIPPGLYFVRIQQGQEQAVVRLIVQ